MLHTPRAIMQRKTTKRETKSSNATVSIECNFIQMEKSRENFNFLHIFIFFFIFIDVPHAERSQHAFIICVCVSHAHNRALAADLWFKQMITSRSEMDCVYEDNDDPFFIRFEHTQTQNLLKIYSLRNQSIILELHGEWSLNWKGAKWSATSNEFFYGILMISTVTFISNRLIMLSEVPAYKGSKFTGSHSMEIHSFAKFA